MGYVKFTERVGDISKTYEFGSYEDFKDWENGEEVFVETDSWIKNTGEQPSHLDENTHIMAKFKNGETNVGPIYSFFGWSKEGIENYHSDDGWLITEYQVVSK